MKNPTRILSTKVLLSHQKQALLDIGLEVLEFDFIQVEVKNIELKGIKDNLIFTSQNAVQSILNQPNGVTLKTKKVFCVGMKTKTLLEENGFEVVAYTDYAEDLSKIISLIYNKENFTFFSGNLRRELLPKTLTKNGIVFNEIQVYETKLKPKKIAQKLDGILFFSPSAVESYLELNTIKNEICFCIGKTTSETLENKDIKNIVIANQPTVENVITEVEEYYKAP